MALRAMCLGMIKRRQRLLLPYAARLVARNALAAARIELTGLGCPGITVKKVT